MRHQRRHEGLARTRLDGLPRVLALPLVRYVGERHRGLLLHLGEDKVLAHRPQHLRQLVDEGEGGGLAVLRLRLGELHVVGEAVAHRSLERRRQVRCCGVCNRLVRVRLRLRLRLWVRVGGRVRAQRGGCGWVGVRHLDASPPLAKVPTRPGRLDFGQHPRRRVGWLLDWLPLAPCRRLARARAVGLSLGLSLDLGGGISERHDGWRVVRGVEQR